MNTTNFIDDITSTNHTDSMILIQSKAKALFSHIFNHIECNLPYTKDSNLYIPFTWNDIPKRCGLMSFEIHENNISFDPFTSRPYEFEKLGIDWVKLKYIIREHAIYTLEEFIRSLMPFDIPAKHLKF